MKFICHGLRLLLNLRCVRDKVRYYTVLYLFRYHIFPLIRRMDKEDIVLDSSGATLFRAVESAPFKDGLLPYFLRANDYVPDVKDFAAAFCIGIKGYANPQDNAVKERLIDFAYTLARQLKERCRTDLIAACMFKIWGKNIDGIDSDTDRSAVLRIFAGKRSLFSHYFGLYAVRTCGTPITVYCPCEEGNYVEYSDQNNVLTVPIDKYDIPSGFFLPGFDYRFGDRWLRCAVRDGVNERFNSELSEYRNPIWMA